MARAHELCTGMAPEGYPVRPVDKWFLKTKADLELNGNSFGGHFLDTTTSHELPRHVLERTKFTVACNRGANAGADEPGSRHKPLPDLSPEKSPKAGPSPAQKKRLRLPPADESQQPETVRHGGRQNASTGDLHRLPQLGQTGGFHMDPGRTTRGKKLKAISADTRYAKRGWGRGGPMFWPESSFCMSQTMTNLHSYC
ncbi:unnamed protein product [Symbiodinium necroappetens]|uniref:Uncharacterized protein n=1 Tax=Symbiodinium necroappetens TaxID=1628268 RepID=A0A813CJ56_9DINO|nr:unnamed protein product [Symbiodinium necroappetens]